ncbi:hypothetical protein PTSG_07546 [Salpingoeca rosetta]|uniref:Uncharacterized protein n=1 Tax=Salpingoeca rosetta (strain ATCC 50818 / BSB-021) TaxID=946362 RepID=F2UH30_SALR5|nr:uncharacterized protein PTSG_07546 [Salpingoeca rosetta]EGD76429.1 hypothetical protein PTSG_07546 [Salpingoeca rosetta]|eukprot:XP_004991344.1 hypothetical protein PTSG_07546 [Salpingoeca rosetta]
MASLKAGGKLASKGNVDGVARWIEQRVKQHGSLDVGAVNGSGDTMLHLAARHGHARVLELLLAQGPSKDEVNARNTVGHTPLHEAALCSDSTCVQLLLAAGADVHIAKHADWTALHLAATKPNANAVQQLLAAGADATRLNKDVGSENFKTTEADALHILDLLTAKCPQGLNQPDHHGLTPLHLAAMHGHAEHVSHLIAVGADATKADIKGRTPLDLARARRKDNTAAVLEACSS